MTEQQRFSELPEHPAPAVAKPERLHISGLVRHPLDLDPNELALLPQTTVTEDFDCEEGWQVPGQSWQGVSVANLLDSAGVDEEDLWVEFGADDFRFSAPITEARKAIVALSLNGAPLTRSHGGPCRLYLPGEACYTSIKWLDRIEVRRTPGPNLAAVVAQQRLANAEARRQ